MYPNLLAPLLLTLAVLAGGLGYAALRHPVSRRLAARQLARHRGEALLAITGATLGTAIIVGALVVGDTLNFSVRQAAYRTLGPIDERVVSTSASAGDEVSAKLSGLRSDARVDGVLDAHVDQAAALDRSGRYAEPRVLAWDVDFARAATFGRAGGPSGLSGAGPSAGQVVINQPLARSLNAHAGQAIALYLYGRTYQFRVARVVAERGLAGAGLGATINRNAFLPAGVLDSAAAAAGTQPRAVTFVSNRGGVERGAALTSPVAATIRHDLLGLTAQVDSPKQDVLTSARKTGDALGALFLMIGSFSVIAGALLLVNIFVMLAEERKSQLGMLRAIGMKRSRLVESFSLEGSAYALAATVPGVLLGLGVGWAVAILSAQIFRGWSADGSGLAITFAVTPTSVVNAVALGLVISFATVVATSVRISRFNIIAAIRDLPRSATARTRRLTLVTSTALALVATAAAVPAIAASQAESTLLLPALAAVLAVPALRRVAPARSVLSAVAVAVLVWTMTASVVRPHMFDNPSMAVYVIQGTLVAFSGVILVSQNQHAVLRPVRRLIQRPTETGLATRLAVAYPLTKRFRTGATLIMYTLISLVLVLLVQITGVINNSVNANVADATAGYSLRVDVNPLGATRTLTDVTRTPGVAGITSLVSAPAFATDPGRRTTAPLPAVAVGVPATGLTSMRFSSRLHGLNTDRAVWALVAADTSYVVVDQFFGATGGPNGRYYRPGDTFTVTNPRTGATRQKIIAGILANATVFYPASSSSGAVYPLVANVQAVRQLFGPAAQVSAALVRTRHGVDPQRLAPTLQARYLSASLVATPIAVNVRRSFGSSTAFFRLMQGFLALGLLVGITGLGVVMVRAVRERRRTIGVLRALGFQSRSIERSFLIESAFIAAEGVLLGSLLGVLTTWLMYQKSAAFDGVRNGYPIQWPTIAMLAAATLAASVLATTAPAKRAAKVTPALAVRVAD
ncbi:MAG TPA: FtsX-like permease family protein [Jatrophihabitantaceae bacterium]|jgi:putative ABC transport system permease protein